MGRFVTALVILWCAASGVAAQDLTQRQQKIVRTALEGVKGALKSGSTLGSRGAGTE